MKLMYQVIAKRFGLSSKTMAKFLHAIHGKDWGECRPTDLIPIAEGVGINTNLPLVDIMIRLIRKVVDEDKRVNTNIV